MKTGASLVLLGLAVSVAGIVIFSMQAYGQESYNIPSWIKNNAKWWAEGQIGDSDFLKGIQYLIDNNILHVSASSQNSPNNGISNNVGSDIPRVYTDKDTYGVGDTVKISGSGFQSGHVSLISIDMYDVYNSGSSSISDFMNNPFFGVAVNKFGTFIDAQSNDGEFTRNITMNKTSYKNVIIATQNFDDFSSYKLSRIAYTYFKIK